MFSGKFRSLRYGEGDNSVTDRMHYESAREICYAVAALPDLFNQSALVEAITSRIPRLITDTVRRQQLSAHIADTLASTAGSSTSRIAIEAVRQILARDIT